MSKKHPPKFPRPIARFLQLEGGQYGTCDLVALTRHQLELQLGGDFVDFTRAQAGDLRDAVQKFLDLEDRTDEELEEAERAVEVAAGDAERLPGPVMRQAREARPRRRARA
jgi:hypothetical protein